MNELDAITIMQNMLNSLRTTMMYKNTNSIKIDMNDYMLEEALGIVLEKAKKNVRLEGVAQILNTAKESKDGRE